MSKSLTNNTIKELSFLGIGKCKFSCCSNFNNKEINYLSRIYFWPLIFPSKIKSFSLLLFFSPLLILTSTIWIWIVLFFSLIYLLNLSNFLVKNERLKIVTKISSIFSRTFQIHLPPQISQPPPPSPPGLLFPKKKLKLLRSS